MYTETICQYGFYTCSFVGEQNFCTCCDGGNNYQMKEKTKKNPKGAGAKSLYGEETASVGFRCPKSKVKEFREIGSKALNKWKQAKSKSTY